MVILRLKISKRNAFLQLVPQIEHPVALCTRNPQRSTDFYPFECLRKSPLEIYHQWLENTTHTPLITFSTIEMVCCLYWGRPAGVDFKLPLLLPAYIVSWEQVNRTNLKYKEIGKMHLE